MKSDTPKVLHRIGGDPLLGHALRAAHGAEAENVAVVVRHERDRVIEFINQADPTAIIADQDEIKGTGRAVECGLLALDPQLQGTVLVTMGDVPLLSGETLTALTEAHVTAGAAVTVITATLDDPKSYGRIVRGADGSVERIVEFKDATDAEREIKEFNSGIYAFDAEVLRTALPKIGTDNAQGEKYLTDVLQLAREAGGKVEAFLCDDIWQTEGVNDRVQLARLGKVLNQRTCERWMREGVTIVDPDTTWIDVHATIERDALILPGTQVIGASTIGTHAVIGPDTTLIDTEVGAHAEVKRTEANLAVIGADAKVGPFSYLRPGTELGVGGKIGGFVETKNAKIHDGAKVPHLAYCGDAVVGEGSNVGAGTIFANYDGTNKHQTVLGKHSFVGSNSVLVAPVTLADGAYVAAGSAITKNVGPGELAVTRAQQRNIAGWVERTRPDSAAAAAAAAARTTDAQTSTEGEQEQA